MGYWHVPIERVDWAIDRIASSANLHQASQAPLLSTTSGIWNPAMGCFALVLGIWPLTAVKSPALTGLGDAVNYAACGARSLLLGSSAASIVRRRAGASARTGGAC